MNLNDFRSVMKTKGWVVIPNVVSQKLVARMLEDLMPSYEICRRIQQENGVAHDAELTVHHLPAIKESYIELLQELTSVRELIEDHFGSPFILNSLGGAINTKGKTSYAQRVHRDIRTYTGDFPLVLNTLIMLDDFRPENGATWLLSGSHLKSEKPTDEFFKANAEQAIGTAGSMLLFNSNVWHAGGDNVTDKPRRSVTPMFSRSFIKQQFDYPRAIGYDKMEVYSPELLQMLGYFARVPASLHEWYQPPEKRFYRPNQG